MNSKDLYSIWTAAILDGGSIAMWKSPDSAGVHFLADMSGCPIKGALDLERASFGFAISPFMNSAGVETLFLNADVYTLFSTDDLLDCDKAVSYHKCMLPNLKKPRARNHFKKMVEDGIKAIASGEFDKVVASRTMDVASPDDCNVVMLFSKMIMAHPEAFVSLVSVSGMGTWIGASPELLVESSENSFRTVSLAGTQAFAADADLLDARWSQKEIEEQAMVSRYIVEQFKTLRLREFVESGPETVRAGNMIHLKTEYHVDLNQVQYYDLGTVMLNLLHPTSAVCGMPRVPAQDFISANEGMDRGLYSGYLGPVNLDGATHLYVNLRCMQICSRHIILYAGAGVTHNSNAEKEWDETTLKCQALLDIIKS